MRRAACGVRRAACDAHSADGEATVTMTPYMYLMLNLPPPPLFKDELDRNIIPQVPLTTLLSQYDGKTVMVDTRRSMQRTYKIKQLPPYLILVMQRFSKNNWNLEKNPTIINFPIKNIDFKDCTSQRRKPPSEKERERERERERAGGLVFDANTAPARDGGARGGRGCAVVDAGDAATAVTGEPLGSRYDLVANITHEGGPGAGKGVYKIHLLNKAKEQWLEIQDLFVEERSPQMIFLSESYIQIWERKDIAGALVL